MTNCNYMVLDLETGSKEQYQRKGNPFTGNNVIVAAGYKNEIINEAIYLGDVADESPRYNTVMQVIPPSTRILVGHNIKYDLLYLWKSTRLQQLLQNGLKIWDTALVEFYLTAQKHKFPALREIAVNKYSCPERIKIMESYWDQGIDTTDIPKETVLNDVCDDVLYTEKIYLNQLIQVNQCKMLPLIETLNDELLCTTEMEYNGMYVDKNKLYVNKLLLQTDLERCVVEFNKLISIYWG